MKRHGCCYIILRLFQVLFSCWFLLVLKRIKKTTLFVAFFCISFFCFLFSQQFLYVFGYTIKTVSVSIYKLVSFEDITVSTYYSIMFMCAMMGGILFRVDNKKQSIKVYSDSSEEQSFDRSTLKACKIIFLVSIIPSVYCVANLLSNARTIGYDAIFEASDSLLMRVCSYFLSSFVSSSFGLILCQKKKSPVRIICVVIILLLSLCYFMMGDRAFPAALILALICLFTDFSLLGDKSVSVWKKAFRVGTALVVIFALIFIFPLIQNARAGKDSLLSAASLYQSYSNAGNMFLDTFLDSIGSMGFSATSLPYTMNLVPESFSYRYGFTYIVAFTVIIPNFLSGLGVVHPASTYASLARWLQNALNISWGPGFSMPAEAYINMGWLGIIPAVITGIVIGKVLIPKESNISGRISKYSLLLTLGVFINCISMPRRDLVNPLRNILYAILPFMILVYFLRKKEKT